MEELRTDPLIKEDFARLFVGMPSEVPFNKSHVEVSYMEPAAAPHYFCEPVEGTSPGRAPMRPQPIPTFWRFWA